MIPELIYCAHGNRRFAEIAIKHGFKYGSQSAKTVYFPPMFIDYDFKCKKSKWIRHVADCRKYRPELAIIPDWMEYRRLGELVELRAVEIAPFVGEILIVPKVKGGIAELPRVIAGKRVRLAYSVATSFGATDVPLDEFGDWPVHLLGGSPQKQIEVAKRLNVISADGNYAQKLAVENNQYFHAGGLVGAKNRYWPQLQESILGHISHDAPYVAFELSCLNIMAAWNGETYPIEDYKKELIAA